MGQLQRCLVSGEYWQLQECLLFESNFLQVTKSGDVASRVTLGIAATSPHLELPDLLLLVRPVLMPTGGPCCSRCGQWLPLPEEELELFALLPLRFVRLSIEDELRHRLEVRLASGRTFYLQLQAPPTQLERVFGQWARLLERLRYQRPGAWDSAPGCRNQGPPCLGHSMGQLQRCLVSGEYWQLQECLLFESNFLQVTESGDVASRVTLGIAATSPHLELPDLLLLARPVPVPTGGPCCSRCAQRLPLPEEELELFALLPLRFVRLSIEDELRHRLEVRLASGRTFYLQLQAPPTQLERVFGQWARLLERLRYQRPGAWDSAPGCRNQGPPCLGHSMGQLQRCLVSGEYWQLQECLLFESNFLQVTESGDVASRVTLGIAATSPHLELPDLLLLARPVPVPTGGPCCSRCAQRLPLPEEELELFALLPLRFVRLSIEDELRHRLEVRLASGRTFYLQLQAPPTQLERVFEQWVRLLERLRYQRPGAWDSGYSTPSGRKSGHRAAALPETRPTELGVGGASRPSPEGEPEDAAAPQ